MSMRAPNGTSCGRVPSRAPHDILGALEHRAQSAPSRQCPETSHAIHQGCHQVMKLVSANTSPYARKVRIALYEKNIDCDLIEDTPWNPDTCTSRFNPLE
jgi:hypothetical protein